MLLLALILYVAGRLMKSKNDIKNQASAIE